jgi:hypothetical protein
MPRVALPDSLQPCRISGCLYTPTDQDQEISSFVIDYFKHFFVSFIIDNLFMRRTFQDPIGYPQILNIIELRPLRGQHAYKAEVSPTRLLVAMLGDQSVSTLYSIKTIP